AGKDDQSVRVWDVATGLEVSPPLRGHTELVYRVAYSPDGQSLASGSDDGTVRIWDARTGQQRLTVEHNGHVQCMAFSPDGQWVAWSAGGGGSEADSEVKGWEARTGVEALTLRGHVGRLSGTVAFSPDGHRLATGGGSLDGTVKLWDLSTGQETLT